MDDKEKILNKLKKLLALAKGGKGGEKVNAEKFLNTLLDKHNLTLQDISDDIVLEQKVYHHYGRRYGFLMNQIIWSVIGNEEIYSWKGHRTLISFNSTVAQLAEIMMKYNIYSRALDTHMDDAYSAFIQANDIYPQNAKVSSLKDYTEEDLERRERVSDLASSTRKTAIHKQLENNNE